MTQIQQLIAVDRAIDLLASPQRRELITYLLEEVDTWIERRELAQYLHDEGAEMETLVVGLIHNHLPRLADAGMIDYDHRSGAVRPTAALEDLQPLLEVCEELEDIFD